MRASLVMLLTTALCASGCTRDAAPQRRDAAGAPAGQSGSEGGAGRYIIIHSPQTERDVILLDTATGRTWTLAEQVWLNGDPPAWEPIPQINSEADRAAAADEYGRKAKPAPQSDAASTTAASDSNSSE